MAKNDDEDNEPNTIEVVNISAETMKFELDGVRFKMAPKSVEKIHKNYATPMILQEGRDPIPSTIERLTNRKVLPVTDKRAKAVMATRQGNA